MSKVRTPHAKTTKKIKPCEDVDLEFCTRALSLLASFYEATPSTEPITTFPPVNSTKSIQSERKIEFHSNIVDLRLRKQEDQRQNSLQKMDESIRKQADEIEQKLKTSHVDIDDAFEPEHADRPETPLYITNAIRAEEKEEALLMRRQRKPVDMATMTKQFTKRAEEAKKRGEERARNRVQKLKELEKTSTLKTPRSTSNQLSSGKKQSITERKR